MMKIHSESHPLGEPLGARLLSRTGYAPTGVRAY